MTATPHYDAVVVGSGFGGSVMAYRMAEAGLRVLVLERGKAYPPGSFARSPAEMRRNFWDPSEGDQGLIDFWSFRGIDAIVASGLGGGSLVYANVLLRKDEKWFVREQPCGGPFEYWPVVRDELELHYDRVEAMLNAQRYPVAHEPYRDTAKARAMCDAATRLRLHHEHPPLAIAFANPGRPPRPGEPLDDRPGHNRYGVPRTTCRLCAECFLGCNYGAKETLDLTYLSAAERQPVPAEIRVRHEVRDFVREGNRWRVGFVVHRPEAEGVETPTRDLPVDQVTCERLVLAAGSLGTTFLLLSMRDRHPERFAGVGPRLGTGFTGNGDLQTFIMRARRRAGGELEPRPLEPTRGPTITTAVRVADELDGDGATGRGLWIEDGGFPLWVAWLAETLGGGVASLGRALGLAGRYLEGALGLVRDTDLSAEIAEAIGPGTLTDTSLPLLFMGRDVADGRMWLEDGLLQLSWRVDRSRDYFDRARGVARDLAEALHGSYAENPLYYLRRLITVHPLGGSPMGRNSAEGVVDPWGNVYGCPGLYVACGAMMPGPAGVNPALTIAALADRFAERLIADHQAGRFPD